MINKMQEAISAVKAGLTKEHLDMLLDPLLVHNLEVMMKDNEAFAALVTYKSIFTKIQILMAIAFEYGKITGEQIAIDKQVENSLLEIERNLE